MKTDLFIEFGGRKIEQKNIVDTAKEIWKNSGNKVKDLQRLELFYKPDEGKCYYIFNEDLTGNFDI